MASKTGYKLSGLELRGVPPVPPLLLEGIAQFNRGEYFEQHETLEVLWRAESGEIRRLYQGILQVGVGLYHLRRGNYHGTVTLLGRGLANLTPFTPVSLGIDVQGLLEASVLVLREVERLGRHDLSAFDWGLAPRVRVGVSETLLP